MSNERRPIQLGDEMDDNAFIAFGAQLAALTSMEAWGAFEQVVNAYLTAIAVQGLDSEEPKEILRAKRDAVKAVFSNTRALILRAQELQSEQQGAADTLSRFTGDEDVTGPGDVVGAGE